MNDTSIYATIIRDYIHHGFAPVPIPFRSKNPILEGWTKLGITEENWHTYFDKTPINIGILTGKPSGGLVDVDLDSVEAVRFGPYFLPKTNCVFGHASKVKSHWLYRVPDASSLEQFKKPPTK
jgi:hypothetical protein